jgi:regulatory protein
MSNLDSSDEKLILAKIMKFCAYRERTWKEVDIKLKECLATDEIKQRIKTFLADENFVNEERFSNAFVRGKSSIKKWGKIKIKSELQRKRVNPESFEEAFESIDNHEYKERLKGLLETRNTKFKDETGYDRKVKLVRYGMSKGYESDIVWELVNTILAKPEE